MNPASIAAKENKLKQDNKSIWLVSPKRNKPAVCSRGLDDLSREKVFSPHLKRRSIILVEEI